MKVYAIQVLESGEAYFGSSKHLAKRWARHRYDLKRGAHHNTGLQAAYNRVGLQGLVFVELSAELSVEAAHALEGALLKSTKALNIGLGVRGGDNLTRHPERASLTTKRAATQRQRIDAMSAEDRVRLWGRPGKQNPMYGRTHSTGSKQAMSASQLARNAFGPLSSFYGRKHSEEAKRKFSVLASARTGALNGFYGRKHSEQTKQLMSERHKGSTPKNVRPVVCDGVPHPSATAAGKTLGVCTATILFRIKSKYWDYSYA